MRPEKIVHRNGLPLRVMRPADPEKAARIGQEAAAANDAERLANLMEEVGLDTYTFVGFLSKDTRSVVDENGKTIGQLQIGDSFATVSPASVAKRPAGSRKAVH